MATIVISVPDDRAREINEWLQSHLTITLRSTGLKRTWVINRDDMTIDGRPGGE